MNAVLDFFTISIPLIVLSWMLKKKKKRNAKILSKTNVKHKMFY